MIVHSGTIVKYIALDESGQFKGMREDVRESILVDRCCDDDTVHNPEDYGFVVSRISVGE